MSTYNGIIYETSRNYFQSLEQGEIKQPKEIEQELLDLIAEKFALQNLTRTKEDRFRVPCKLPNFVIAQAVLHTEYVRQIRFSNGESTLLCIYQKSGNNKGIYVDSEEMIRSKIRQFNMSIDRKGIQEVIAILEENAPVVMQNQAPDLIAVRNGIFNYKTKVLQPFSPEIVVTSKTDIDYVANAQNPVIHNPNDGTDWDVESWIESLSDDPGVVRLLWQLLGAVIRPHVRWNKTAFLYSGQGNNGKGTLCELLRNVCGKRRCASISIANFAKDFMLEPLTKSLAVIVDENPTNVVVKNAANFKAAITGDVLQINRKYKQAIDCSFRGMIVQCINALPKFEDNSESIYRRLLIIPFQKCFTGQERQYIKEDYLNRQDVLEYVVYRALNQPDYYEFTSVSACQKMLRQYQEFNDPVREYLDEMLPAFQWDLVPYAFMYDLYKKWLAKNYPTEAPLGRNIFVRKIRQQLAKDPVWEALQSSVKPGKMMDKSENLMLEWDLREWIDSSDVTEEGSPVCQVVPKESYMGIRRR